MRRTDFSSARHPSTNIFDIVCRKSRCCLFAIFCFVKSSRHRTKDSVLSCKHRQTIGSEICKSIMKSSCYSASALLIMRGRHWLIILRVLVSKSVFVSALSNRTSVVDWWNICDLSSKAKRCFLVFTFWPIWHMQYLWPLGCSLSDVRF